MRAWLKGTNSNRRTLPPAKTRTKPLSPRSTRVCATQRPAARSSSKKSASYFPSGLPPPLLAKSLDNFGEIIGHIAEDDPEAASRFREFFVGPRGLVEPVSSDGRCNEEALTSAKTPAQPNSRVYIVPRRQANGGSAASPARLQTVSPILILCLRLLVC